MKTVLIVDDIEANRYMLSALFGAKGYRTVCARNGVEALLALPGPDLIISDILMPEMDGYELCRRVRADPRVRDLPFVFYTATYTNDTDRRFALELGADLFIIKPAEPEELLRLVEPVLAGEAKAREQSAGKRPRGGLFAGFDRGMDDTAFLYRHERALAYKLDQKMQELDATNRMLSGERDYVEAVMDSILDPIGVLDEAGVLRGANRAWAIVSETGLGIGGLPSAIGEGVQLPEDTSSPNFEVCSACLSVAAGSAPSYWEEIGSSDGESWYIIRAVPLKTGGGAVLSIVDISHRKAAELEAVRHAARSEALLHELFHRTGNSLQIISSLMSIYGDGVGAEASLLLRKIDTRVQALRMVQDKLYESETLSEINVRDYVSDLFMLLNGSLEGRTAAVRLELFVPPLMLDIDTLTPMGLILTELICNALLYAFEGRAEGALRISLEQGEDGYMALTVEDDGNGGLPHDVTGPGMSGLRIAREIAEHQLMGALELSAGASGSRCSIRWPGRPGASPPSAP